MWYKNNELLLEVSIKMEEEEKLLKWLVIQSNRLDGHSNKIWEEMKHFSWALYLLLGASFFLKQWEYADIWLIIFPILAIIVAIIGIKSIYNENKNFLETLGMVLSAEKRLGFHDENNNKTPKMLISEERKKMLHPKDDGSIDDFIKRNEPIIFRRISTRSLFVIYFIMLIIVGFAEIFYFAM